MKGNKVMLVMICLAAMLTLVAIDGYGQIPESDVRTYDHEVTDIEVVAKRFTLNKNITMTITFLIGVLGLISGALQKMDKKWCKSATIIAGLSVGVLTLGTNTFFPADFREYQKAVSKSHIAFDYFSIFRSSSIG